MKNTGTDIYTNDEKRCARRNPKEKNNNNEQNRHDKLGAKKTLHGNKHQIK